MIQVFLVDDHQMFIEGLSAIIKTLDGMEVAGSANDGLDLIDALTKVKADVILLDINMPKMNGLESMVYLNKNFPEVKVLVLSMHDQGRYIEKMLKAGAHGYVLKNTGKDELGKAINAIYNGENYYSATVTQRIMEGMQKQQKLKQQMGPDDLSKRELEVLKLIAQDLSTNEIAEKLIISHHTVESHRKNLLAKLQVRSSAGLVRFAVESNLLD